MYTTMFYLSNHLKTFIIATRHNASFVNDIQYSTFNLPKTKYQFLQQHHYLLD